MTDPTPWFPPDPAGPLEGVADRNGNIYPPEVWRKAAEAFKRLLAEGKVAPPRLCHRPSFSLTARDTMQAEPRLLPGRQKPPGVLLDFVFKPLPLPDEGHHIKTITRRMDKYRYVAKGTHETKIIRHEGEVTAATAFEAAELADKEVRNLFPGIVLEDDDAAGPGTPVVFVKREIVNRIVTNSKRDLVTGALLREELPEEFKTQYPATTRIVTRQINPEES